MKLIQVAVAASLALSSTLTYAFHCPADMKKIDEAMSRNPRLSEEQLTQVKKYRADGETLHKAGKHQESVDTLAKAMTLLNIK